MLCTRELCLLSLVKVGVSFNRKARLLIEKVLIVAPNSTATNQAVNFTVYQYFKDALLRLQPDLDTLPSYQHLLAGGISGAMGPIANNPIDTLKTRIQRTRILPGSELEKMGGFKRGWTLFNDVLKNEGWRAFYKGLLPRVMVGGRL